jgi:DNA end-binding protein Ku
MSTKRKTARGKSGTRARRGSHASRSTSKAPAGGRTIWKGHLTFGLVSVPIRLHAAVESSEHVAFRLLHRKDHAPITYKKFCSREDVEVPADEIVRGYEVAKNKFTVVEKEELEEVQEELGEGQHTIELLQFVEAASLDPLLFDRPYYLLPDEGGEKAYALLRDALRDSGRVGVARLYMRRPVLGALLPHEKLLTLEAMRPFEELRKADDFPVPERKASEGEKRMARALIDEMSTEWDPRAHPNRYRATLEKLLEGRARFALAEGGEGAAEAEGKTGKVVDLMEALRQSLGSAGGRARSGARRAGTPPRKRPQRARSA